MVKLTSVTAFMMLAVGQALAAATEVHSTFSFSNWVEGIIANPDGDNLTPEEAVAAFYEATDNERRSMMPEGRGLLRKRVTCNEQPNTEAPVPDAVACINQIARKGSQACPARIHNYCQIGRAIITGDGRTSSTSSSCNDVARGAGLIMDRCTRADNTVQGSGYAWGNGDLLVRIRRA